MELRTGLNVLCWITEILNKSPSKDLHCLNFFWGGPDWQPADAVANVSLRKSTLLLLNYDRNDLR
jgi:hypothetical protein